MGPPSGDATPPDPADPTSGAEPSSWGQAPSPSPFGPESTAQVPPIYQPPSHTWGPATGAGYPRSSTAKAALVLSIMGLVCCFLGPVGLALGAIDLRAIDRGLTDPSNRGSARAAVIVGAIGSVLLLGFIALFLFLSAVSVRSAT